ncbi:uncharacterized protein MELLADRAFT_67208 [Melampsora larici-populina 98AG31]|uniref:Golgi to ER traffic-protein n=1 Tax=Melampsora larici-populina (strain 98AG31 / pathotype 3-4-7) TaxID=747676 RepID=F4S272_MELLP|nr:uncharacterized protein MELLADRAFT_67208 [Melampsora larici-populina 98AG31]EGG01255.1 hypothetical protein MELLADRAFT_67208 [Melampsora larici-populina 98AG31]
MLADGEHSAKLAHDSELVQVLIFRFSKPDPCVNPFTPRPYPDPTIPDPTRPEIPDNKPKRTSKDEPFEPSTHPMFDQRLNKCIDPPARRWRAATIEVTNERLRSRQANIRMKLNQIKSSAKNRQSQGSSSKDTEVSERNRSTTAPFTPAPSVPATPRAKAAAPVNDLMAPRKVSSIRGSQLLADGEQSQARLTRSLQAPAIVDPKLKTPVQASEPSKIPKTFKAAIISDKQAKKKKVLRLTVIESNRRRKLAADSPQAQKDVQYLLTLAIGEHSSPSTDNVSSLHRRMSKPLRVMVQQTKKIVEDSSSGQETTFAPIEPHKKGISGISKPGKDAYTPDLAPATTTEGDGSANSTEQAGHAQEEPAIRDETMESGEEDQTQVEHERNASQGLKEEDKPATQTMQSVKVQQATEEFEEVRELYNIMKSRVEKLEKKAENGAIDKQLYVLQRSLDELLKTMAEAEHELMVTLTSQHPEVIFVPSVYVPTVETTNVKKSQRDGADTVPEESDKQASGSSMKRKNRTSDATAHDAPRKRMNTKDFEEKEAVECNQEGRADIGIKSTKRRKTQTPAEVPEEDMPQRPESTSKEAEGLVVHPPQKKGKKKPVEDDDEEDGEEQKKVIIPEMFRKGTKPDLARLLKDMTPIEGQEIRNFRDQLINVAFNWGEALTSNVCSIIQLWSFDRRSLDDKPDESDLPSHLEYIKSLVDDHALMEKRIQTAPLLMQLSALDPFFDETSLNWELVEESSMFPFTKDMNGVFRALHAMSCRKSDSTTWTEVSKLKSDIKNGSMILHNILADSLALISYETQHDDIIIRNDGEFMIPEKFIPMSQTVGWLYHQISMRMKPEGNARGDRVASASVNALQAKFFLVLVGTMLVYKSDCYNREDSKNMRRKKTGNNAQEIAELKAIQKDQTCLRQLVNTKHRNVSKRLKGSDTSTTVAKTKAEERKIAQVINHDLSRFRGDAIQAMSLFFLYGTASFFHVWPTTRDTTQHDAALLINLSAILHERRWRNVEDKKHVFGCRAWNRLDSLMHRALKRFITENGDFRNDIDWPALTGYFSRKFDPTNIAQAFTLDLMMEMQRPGLSRGLNGLVQPHVKLEDSEKWLMDGPATQSFRALWGPTEGKLVNPVDGGGSMYPEVNENGRHTLHHTNETRMAADKAKAATEEPGNEESSEEESSEEGPGDGRGGGGHGCTSDSEDPDVEL